MPSWIAKADEADWERAKKIVQKQYPGKESQDSDGFYALVTTVFKSIKKGHKEKAESRDDAASVIDWRAAAAMLSESVSEDRLDVKVEASEVSVGDSVVIATKLGRTMGTGRVTEVSDRVITVMSSNHGIDSVRTYDVSLYTFFAQKTDESRSSLDEARRKRTANQMLRDKIMSKHSSVGPGIDRDEYPPIRGMEGPFSFKKRGVLYYDPREGRYYDRKRDVYLDVDDLPEDVVDLGGGVTESVTVDIGRDTPDDPWGSAKTGPFPAAPDVSNGVWVGVLLGYAGGDQRYAEAIWQDILHIGFSRAMDRHNIDPGDRARIKMALVSTGAIEND